MFFVFIARLLSLTIGGAAGWTVYLNLKTLFEDWSPIASGVGVCMVIFCIIYFPLLKPIAEVLSDRMSVAVHRGRHIRSGTGIDDIPDASPVQRCTLCGAPEGPICRSCQEEMNRSTTY